MDPTERIARVSRGWEAANSGKYLAQWAKEEGVSSSALIQLHKSSNPDLWDKLRENLYENFYATEPVMFYRRLSLLVGQHLGAWTIKAASEYENVSKSRLVRYRNYITGGDNILSVLIDCVGEEKALKWARQCAKTPLHFATESDYDNIYRDKARYTARVNLINYTTNKTFVVHKGQRFVRLMLPEFTQEGIYEPLLMPVPILPRDLPERISNTRFEFLKYPTGERLKNAE